MKAKRLDVSPISVAGECTVAIVTLSGTSVATPAPWLPQIAKDLNIGVVARFVNIAVIALVTVASPRRAMEPAT